MKHGAGSPRKRDPIAQALAAELLLDEAVAYLRAPRYAAAVQAWAVAEAKCALISTWCDSMPIEVAASSPKPGTSAPLELLRKWETTAQSHRSRLGLDPLSAARLGLSVAQTRQADTATALTLMREDFERSMKGEVVDDDK
ncbi:hypothetical protein SAMN04487914_13245 [Arthrobacter sp. ok909]|uniref:hypothetical protein n=1 Tax=Arthrobacter sp. ok909 TaxID=1761746 RepID=UPI00088BCE6A|nr:hypothetical protein [Arthrobacter sp. ok909]SDP74132.1 hypothetical protein SAMN04487914_13245 [Arthrobacter sp. ok909]